MNLLKSYRVSRGISQQQLADELKEVFPGGIDKALISKIENGVVDMSPSMREWLFEVVATSADGFSGLEWENTLSDLKSALEASSAARTIFSLIVDRTADRPITKTELMRATGLSDRDVRDTVSRLRRAGARIGSSSRSKGYWICDAKDYKILRSEYISRARTMLDTVRAMDNAVPGQMEIEFDG